MSSVIQICNMALGHIRAESINDINEASVAAQQCKLFYDVARDKMLDDTDWGFNKGLKPLSLLEQTVFGWAYVWQYPNDCLQINRLVRNIDISGDASSNTTYYPSRNLPAIETLPAVDYQIYNLNGDKVIVTQEAELRVLYQSRISDTTLFPADFLLAVSYMLASLIALRIAGIKDGIPLRGESLAIAERMKIEAANKSANQSQQQEQESDYINIRN